MPGYKIGECNVTEDGVCALHNVEVERRKNQQVQVDKIPTLVKLVYTILGTNALMTTMLIGSYVYTHDVKMSAELRDNAIIKKLETMTSEVSDMNLALARHEGEYRGLLQQMGTFNTNLLAIDNKLAKILEIRLKNYNESQR